MWGIVGGISSSSILPKTEYLLKTYYNSTKKLKELIYVNKPATDKSSTVVMHTGALTPLTLVMKYVNTENVQKA